MAIPSVHSGFRARPAEVYLPPAAASRGAALPVVFLLHGWPGGPGSWDAQELADQAMSLFARTHGGKSPIVVMPDINGSARADTECISDRHGHDVETYLTVDIPAYLMSTYPVARPGRAWMVGGLSEGATCSVMLALRHPQLFGAFADFSGLTSPTVREVVDRVATVRALFHGSNASYDEHDPVWLLGHHRYPGLAGWFFCGAQDTRYLTAQIQLAGLARTAGIRVTSVVGHGSHEHAVWRQALRQFLPTWWYWLRS